MTTQLITKWPSRNPLIVLISICCGAALTIGKHRTRHRQGMEHNIAYPTSMLSAEPVAEETVLTIDAGWQAIPDWPAISPGTLRYGETGNNMRCSILAPSADQTAVSHGT